MRYLIVFSFPLFFCLNSFSIERRIPDECYYKNKIKIILECRKEKKGEENIHNCIHDGLTKFSIKSRDYKATGKNNPCVIKEERRLKERKPKRN